MSGGSAPANTTTTTTINQSPWQNATYRALALGTPGNLGPVAQQLKIGQQLTNDWMDIQSGRNPGLYYGLKNATPERIAQETALRDVGFAAGRAPAPAATTPTPTDTPTAEAAQGGLMSLRGFAPGGSTAPKSKAKPKPAALARPEADKNESGLTTAQQTQWDKLEKLRNSGGKMTQQQIKAYNNLKGIRTTAADAIAADPTKRNQPTGAPFSFSDLATPTAFLDKETGQNMLPDAQLAYQRARELKTPEQIQQATDAYNSAVKGLQGMTNYQAQQVAADKVSGSTMQGREAKASQIARGDVRDINAIMADVERYQAAGMQAPPALQAEAYQAAQMQGAQLEGPKSWTDAGTAQKYMSPYQQAVTNQELYEANRQAQMRENQQRSQATQQKAFGGTRAALQESEGRRNLGYLLSDIQNKGSQQAYTQGMQQFSAEQGLGLQAGQSNLQAALTMQQQNQAATNQQRSLYVQQALDAAKTSYGGELTAAQANQVAQNAASQFNAGAQNQAYNNYVQQQLAAQQANQSMDWNVANQNAQLAQQAELANQQYGLGGFQSNLNNAQFSQQANLANQQAALQAAQANQQAGLQANQQNLGAWGQVGNMAQGLGGLGATRSQINLNNLAALGQSATAQTQYAQSALDRKAQGARDYYNLPSVFNAPGINALNAQQVSGGSTGSNTNYGQANWFSKGGKVQWGPKK